MQFIARLYYNFFIDFVHLGGRFSCFLVPRRGEFSVLLSYVCPIYWTVYTYFNGNFEYDYTAKISKILPWLTGFLSYFFSFYVYYEQNLLVFCSYSMYNFYSFLVNYLSFLLNYYLIFCSIFNTFV